MKTTIVELLRGKGLWRAMLYDAIQSSGFIPASPIADIASGKNPGYWRILGLRRDVVITLDIDPAVQPSVIHDGVSRIPWSDESFGSVLLMNCLYAFPDPLAVMKEVCRILRPYGVVAMSFPLIFPYTPEPYDFRRFTEDGIRYMCSESGFSVTHIMPLGGRWTAAAYLVNPFSGMLAMAAMPMYAMAFALDTLYGLVWPALPPAPIGYFVIAKKT